MVAIIMNTLYRHGGDREPIVLASVADLSSYNYFTRGTISEHLRFATRTLVGRTQPSQRQSVGLKDNPYICHIYVRADGLSGVVVADKEYPLRVAYSLIQQTMADFDKSTGGKWKQAEKDSVDAPEFMQNSLLKFQDPKEADKLTKVQKSLDEVKDVMQKNIEEVLKRGETLDSLMEKSADLSATSVQFYKKAKKTNACCKSF